MFKKPYTPQFQTEYLSDFSDYLSVPILPVLNTEAIKKLEDSIFGQFRQVDKLPAKSVLLLVHIHNMAMMSASNGRVPVCLASNSTLAKLLGMKNSSDMSKTYLKPLIDKGFISRANSPKNLPQKSNGRKKRYKMADFRYIFSHVYGDIPFASEILALYRNDKAVSKETVEMAVGVASRVDPEKIQTRILDIEASVYKAAILSLGSAESQSFKAPTVEGRILDFLDRDLVKSTDEDHRRDNLVRAAPKSINDELSVFNEKMVKVGPGIYEKESELVKDSLESSDEGLDNVEAEDEIIEVEPGVFESYMTLALDSLDNQDIPTLGPLDLDGRIEDELSQYFTDDEYFDDSDIYHPVSPQECQFVAVDLKPERKALEIVGVPVPPCNWDPTKGKIGPPPLRDRFGNPDWSLFYDYTPEQLDLLQREANGEFIPKSPVPQEMEDSDLAFCDYNPDQPMKFYNDYYDEYDSVDIVKPLEPQNKEEFEALVEQEIEKDAFQTLGRQEALERMKDYPSGKYSEMFVDYLFECNSIREYDEDDFEHLLTNAELLEDGRVIMDIYLCSRFKYKVVANKLYPDFVCKELYNRLTRK
jgi:hypothetical protein